ncbi:hypothetical protein LX87_01602 [Larkinella arboricola]|uniref:Uncharacterized protein n=1 Tax=Larkinella arboricola TaxID=643671 RepID=A0A327X0M2_LARAB|nr:hypothetical protein [Larkinella arboricola]RAJ99905.1 hypothetical protein LX87_01602 [Larkinella arboricola]
MIMALGAAFNLYSPATTLTCRQPYSIEQAQAANEAFDAAVKDFLRAWIEHGTVSPKSLEGSADTEDFIEHGALRSFFKHRDDAFERILAQENLARHLLRPIDEVYFQGDAYEPLLAKFERRIYNIAASREHLAVPFRYSPVSRQGDYGDTIQLTDATGQVAPEDIGVYFGTRRADNTALTILAHQLRWEALAPSQLAVHVITEGYMEDSLRRVRTLTEQFREQGIDESQCFVIQRRHAVDDRHLGTALLVMNPHRPTLPQRIIFCDTLRTGPQPPWWDKFKAKIDTVFPQPTGHPPASDKLEDGGVKLQRLHDGVPVRHQDIDCAFYTASMGRALIQLAKAEPELILHGSIEAVISQMTARMPEYYEQPDQPKEPALVREFNVIQRWNTGWHALKNMMQHQLTGLAEQFAMPIERPLEFS